MRSVLSGSLRSGWLAAVLAFAFGGTAASAHANDADRDVAEGIYRAAVAVYAKRHYREAIDLFAEANRLRPSPALSFNIARCYERLRDPKRALLWYRDYLRRAEHARDAAAVKRKIAKLERRLGRKAVEQLDAPPSASEQAVVVIRPRAPQAPPAQAARASAL